MRCTLHYLCVFCPPPSCELNIHVYLNAPFDNVDFPTRLILTPITASLYTTVVFDSSLEVERFARNKETNDEPEQAENRGKDLDNEDLDESIIAVRF
jgi:hypothetical protein